MPRTDTCLVCEKYKNESRIKEAKLQLELHLLRAKKSHQVRKHEAKERTTLVICFDLQQNFPLPCTSIGEAFCSRQLWLFNFGIVCCGSVQNKKNVFLYSWLESESGRWSNEIVSALFNFLKSKECNIVQRKYAKLSLFTDSCPGQNKNHTLLLALLMYVNSGTCPFKTITITFPVRGHSYMEPDQVLLA